LAAIITSLVLKMKKSVLRPLVAVAAMSAAGLGHAQAVDSPLYGEIGYTAIQAKASAGGLSAKFEPGLLTGIVGYRFHPNLSVEGMVGVGMGDDDVTVNGFNTGIKGKLGTSFGVFLRPSMHVSESVELFGRVGFVRSSVKLSMAGMSESDSDTGLAFGFGANFHLTKSSYLQASWTSHYYDDGVKLEGLGVAWGMKF
jgi:attachment invasion locus protein